MIALGCSRASLFSPSRQEFDKLSGVMNSFTSYKLLDSDYIWILHVHWTILTVLIAHHSTLQFTLDWNLGTIFLIWPDATCRSRGHLAQEGWQKSCSNVSPFEFSHANSPREVPRRRRGSKRRGSQISCFGGYVIAGLLTLLPVQLLAAGW